MSTGWIRIRSIRARASGPQAATAGPDILYVRYYQAVAAAEVHEALVEVEIGVAEPGGSDPNQDLAPRRDGVVHFSLDQIKDLPGLVGTETGLSDWVEITQDGRFLFTVNTASGTISGYRIAANGALSLLPGSTPADGPNAGASTPG